jgi:adenylate cyclase
MCAWTALETSRAVLGKAVDAAIELSKKIEQFALDHGSMQLNPRIGLYEGHFYLGHTGGGGRYLYSILGDTANTAARLESLNKQLGTQILASESVVSGRKGLLLRPLGSICLAGKADPISVVQVFGSRSNASPEHLALCQQFATALAAFHNKEWSRAADLFEALIATFGNDGPSQLYLARSRKFEAGGETERDPTVIHMDHK